MTKPGVALRAAPALRPRGMSARGPIVVTGAGPAIGLAALVGVSALAAAAWLSPLFDGALAGRQGFGSAFGARFDCEVDALLILALSAVTLASGTVPAWALGIGVLHYQLYYLVAGVRISLMGTPKKLL